MMNAMLNPKLKTALILLVIAIVFFVGVLLRHW